MEDNALETLLYYYRLSIPDIEPAIVKKKKAASCEYVCFC